MAGIKLPRGRLARRVRQEYRYLKGLMSHPRTPKPARWLIGAGLAYLISPIDLIPDFIPVIGQLDDLLVLGLCIGIAVVLIPKDVKQASRQRSSSILRKRAQNDADRPPNYVFETAPLPSEFGVRVMYVNPSHELSIDVIGQLETLILEHHLIVADDKLFAALNAKPLRLRSLGVRHNQLPDFAAEFDLVDLTMAYRGLSKDDRQAIERFTVTGRAPGMFGHIATAPLVWRHPQTREKFLHPCLPRVRIRELTDSASEEWIGKLIVHTQQPGYRFQPANRTDQVIAWDTIAVQPLLRSLPTEIPTNMAGHQIPY